MNKLDEIRFLCPDSELVVIDEFEDCIIGVDVEYDRVCYSFDKCIETLINKDGMSLEEANEFMMFNTTSAYIGEKTPLFIKEI